MPSTYTLNNGIELIGTGEQSGTWGDTTNINFQLVDTALDGQVSINLTSTGTSGSPNLLEISDGATSSGRNRLVIFTGTPGAADADVFVRLDPNDAEKIIYVRNDLGGTRVIRLFQGTYSASNDYDVPQGTTAVVFFNGAGTGAVAANVFNNAFFDSLRLGGVSVTAILDEDNMSSDSATALATQQSIKKYVDDKAAAQDTLAEVLANGNTTGGTNIQMTTTDELQFRDTALKISSSADGKLDIDADTEIEIVAPTVDIDASTAMTIDTAALTVTGAVDLNTSLNVDGTVTSDGVTVAGNLSVDGGTIKLDGNYPTGTNNVALGDAAGDALASGGNLNVAVGSNALSALVTGDDNVAVGAYALDNVTGADNVGVGSGSLGNSVNSASQNVGLGSDSLTNLASAAYNTAIGHEAGNVLGDVLVATAIVSGVNYTIQTLGTTDFTLIGAGSNSVGVSFTATGAGSGTGTASANANYNTFVGHQSGDVIVGGSKNSILGRFDGNQGGLDIRNSDNHIVLSDGDGNPRLYFDDSGNMSVDTDTLYVDSTNDRVGINDATPSYTLDLKRTDAAGGYAYLGASSDGGSRGLIFTSSDNGIYLGAVHEIDASSSGGQIALSTGNSEAMRIDSSQRVVIGGIGSAQLGAIQHKLQLFANNAAGASLSRYSNTASGTYFTLHHTRATSAGGTTILQNDDTMGTIQFAGSDGTNNVPVSASIFGEIDGAPSEDDMPGRLVFATTLDGAQSPTERMRITNGGRVGINTAGESGTPLGYLTIDNDINSANVLTNKASYHVVLGINGSHTGEYIGGIGFGDITQSTIQAAISATDEGTGAAAGIAFATGNTSAVNEAMRIDSSQRVLIKHTTAQTFSLTPQLSVLGTDASSSAAQVGRFQNGAFASYYQFAKSRSTSIGSHVIVQDGDTIGNLRALADDGVNYDAVAASIEFVVDGTPDTNDMPGRIMFSTSASGSDSPTERMRINSSGMVIINNGDVSTGTGTNKALLQVANIDTTSDWTAINTGANGYASTANEIAVLNTANQDLNGFAGIFFQAGENSNGSAINAARIGAIKTSTSGTSTDLGFATRDSSAVMAERMRITHSGGIIFQGPTPAGSTAIASGTLGSTNTFAELAGSGGSGTMVLSRGTTSNDAEIGSLRYVNRTNSSDSGLGSTGRLIAGISVRSVTSDSNAGGDSGSTMKFYTKPEAGSYAERLTIASGGNVTVKTGNLIIGTSGQGIDFSATGDGSGTDTSELLDDYEEGTWTPTADAGITGFSIQSATYTKVGRMVTLMFYVTSPSGNSGSNLQIGGLPYTPASQNYSTGWVECNTNGHMGMARVNSSNTYLSFFYPDASTSQRVSLTGNDVGSSHILGSITYQTSG